MASPAHVFRITLLNLALVASAEYVIDPQGSFFDRNAKHSKPTLHERTAETQQRMTKGGMMRREAVKDEKESLADSQDAQETSTKMSRSHHRGIAITAPGQFKSEREDREEVDGSDPFHSVDESVDAQPALIPFQPGSESAVEKEASAGNMHHESAKTQDALPAAAVARENDAAVKAGSEVGFGVMQTAGDGTPDGEVHERKWEGIKDAALVDQQEELSQEVMNRNADSDRRVAGLTSEDEELYYKLFPEERVDQLKSAASALEVSGKKAFHIRVPVTGGKRLCLTEANHGGRVHAEPCRSKSTRQKWYWVGSTLKNLFSSKRCLGFAKEKHHINNQVESLMEQEKGQADMEAKGQHLSMSFQCSDDHAPLAWALDEKGRLMNNANKQCMAINEHADNEVVVLPCDL